MPPVLGETGLYLKVNSCRFTVKCNNFLTTLYLLGEEIKTCSLIKDIYLDQP